ncbi:MAG: NAD(P)H-dependent oxidoreductase subunit E [Anaerolineales bacterium]|nr:NAD(P)H-dependent oxidoreductase subunit E [Anaerolineales bacterium]
MLLQKYNKEIKQILSKYPPEYKRSAVMPLLHLVQKDEGFVSKEAMQEIAGLLGITETEVGSVVGFYTLYQEKKAGKYRMQICTDLPCALRGADEFLKQVCEHLNVKDGETTQDGLVTVEHVMCLAACDRAPMFQSQGPDGIKYHEYMTIDRVNEWLQSLKQVETGEKR